MLPSGRPEPPDTQKQIRERVEGPRCRKEKGEGAQGKTAFFLLPRLRTEEQGNEAALTMVGGSLPGHVGGQEVGERREEDEGDRFLFSPRGWDGSCRRIDDNGRVAGGDG
jgi:hypothetical protein